jgi:F0F1-type ATP synthase assembly protein I
VRSGKLSEQDDSSIVKAGRFAALGFEFAGTVVAGVLAGYYLDSHLGTPPLFTLLLTLAGMGGALYRLLWSLKQSNSRADDGR